MPEANRLKDVCICGNSLIHNLGEKGGKSLKNDANRLQKLEKEVCRLRNEVEKIKWQREAAESAIERAIARGEAVLGGRYRILVPHDSSGNRDDRGAREMNDGKRGGSTTSNSRTGGVGNYDTNIERNIKKEREKNCGEYTIG